jgi:hypothetical protein
MDLFVFYSLYYYYYSYYCCYYYTCIELDIFLTLDWRPFFAWVFRCSLRFRVTLRVRSVRISVASSVKIMLQSVSGHPNYLCCRITRERLNGFSLNLPSMVCHWRIKLVHFNQCDGCWNVWDGTTILYNDVITHDPLNDVITKDDVVVRDVRLYASYCN